MERNVNFTIVGLIFVFLSICMIIFIFWIGRFSFGDSKILVYKLYTSDDISGISVDTPVKYKGINIGSVLNMRFKKDSTGIIEMDIGINKNIKVHEHSELMIDSQGLAGLNYLTLIQNKEGKIIENEDDAILKLRRNTFQKLLDGAQYLGDSVDTVVKNIKELTNSDKMDKLINSISNLESTKNNLDRVLVSVNRLVNNLDKRLNEGEFNYKGMLNNTLDGLQNSLRNFDELVQKGGYFLDRLENNPYDTLLGKREDK